MASRTEEFRAPRRLLGVGCWAGLWLLYQVLAGSPSWAEAVAGAVAAWLATVAVMSPGSPDHLGRMRWSWWLLLARRLPPAVIGDTARVLAAVLGSTGFSGRFRSVPFEPGGADAVSASRRALVIAGASVAPDAFVVLVEPESKVLLSHELVAKASPPGEGDLLWPI